MGTLPLELVWITGLERSAIKAGEREEAFITGGVAGSCAGSDDDDGDNSVGGNNKMLWDAINGADVPAAAAAAAGAAGVLGLTGAGVTLT